MARINVACDIGPNIVSLVHFAYMEFPCYLDNILQIIESMIFLRIQVFKKSIKSSYTIYNGFWANYTYFNILIFYYNSILLFWYFDIKILKYYSVKL